MCVLLNLFLISFMVQSGLAINCFICDSSTNEKCTDLTDRNIQPEECTYEKLGNMETKNDNYHQKNWLIKISEINYHKLPNAFDIPMVCQKLVGTDENDRTSTLRRCQLKHIEPCNFTLLQVSQYNRRIEHCSTCEENGCNGSSHNEMFVATFAVVTTIAISINFIL